MVKDRGATPRAVGYIRVSKEEQVEGYSLDAQRSEITRYAEERLGYGMARFYCDGGLSAHTDQVEKRPALKALLEDAEAGRLDGEVVIVHELSRWARKVVVQAVALQRLGKAGIGFASVAENIDYTTPAGRLVLTVMGGTHEFFSDQLALHVRKSLAEKARKGLPIGPIPFGYMSCSTRRDGQRVLECPVEHPGGLHVVETEAAAVREGCERIAQGVSNGELADCLNSSGFRTRTGRLFTPWAIKDLATPRFYLGVVHHDDQDYPGLYPALINQAQWDRVHIRLLQGRRGARWNRGTESGVLQGRIRCGRCGSTIHSSRNWTGVPYYRERHGVECGTNGSSTVAHILDAQVGQIFGSLTLSAEWRERVWELRPQSEAVDVAGLMEQRRRLSRAYADGAFTDGEYQARLAALDAKLRSADPVWSPSLDEVAAALANLPALWERANGEEKRRLVAPFLEAAYVDMEDRRIGAIVPVPAFRMLIGLAVAEAGAECELVRPEDPHGIDGLVETGESPAPVSHQSWRLPVRVRPEWGALGVAWRAA